MVYGSGVRVMAQLPPVRTREEAEADAEFVKGALMEAGRPDLAGAVYVSKNPFDAGWVMRTPFWWTRRDAAIYRRAVTLLRPDAACVDCWWRWNDFLDDQIILDCDHVLPAPRSSRPLPVGAPR